MAGFVIVINPSIPIFISLSLLAGCATDAPVDSTSWQKKTEPEYFEVKERKILIQKTSYGGKTADLVITELGVYVLYGKDDAYLNPAYECRYNKFGSSVIEKNDLIGINCKKGADNQLHYFHIPDAVRRSLVISTVNRHSRHIEKNQSSQSAGVVNLSLNLNHMAVMPIDACLSDEALRKIKPYGDELHPLVLLDPNVAGASVIIFSHPAAMFGLGLGLIIEKFINLMPRKAPKDKFTNTYTSLIGSSIGFSVILVETLKSQVAADVRLTAKTCDNSKKENIQNITTVNNDFSAIIKIDSLGGKLLGYNKSDLGEYDSELWLFCSYSIVNVKNGDVVQKGTVQYVNANPMNLTDKSAINNEILLPILKDAYKDMARILIDNLVLIPDF